MKEKSKEKRREGPVFLRIVHSVERILTIMQQWFWTKLIFVVRDIGPREGLMTALR